MRRIFQSTVAIAGLWMAAWASAGAESPAPEAPHGLIPSLTYDGSVASNLRGGAQTGTAYIGNLHFKLALDGTADGCPDTSAFLDVLNIHGGSASRLVGDVEGVSNIEGPAGTQIEELWVEHTFGRSGFSVLAGIYDLNGEFDRLMSAGLFQNSAFGVGTEFSQSGAEGPSIFPRTSAGFRLSWKPVATVVLRAALLDGVPVARPDGSRRVFASGDGALGVAEIAFSSSPRMRESGSPVRTQDRLGRFSSLARSEDKVALGVWHYTADFVDLSDVDTRGRPIVRHGSSGVYLVGEQLWIGTREGSGQRLAAFAQMGASDPRTNRFGARVGAGLVGSGWGFVGAQTQLGVSVTRARGGSHARRAGQAVELSEARDETTYELTALAPVTKSVTLQPDLQYVQHPGANTALVAAWLLQLRFEVSF